jgi:hypothetical protein
MCDFVPLYLHVFWSSCAVWKVFPICLNLLRTSVITNNYLSMYTFREVFYIYDTCTWVLAIAGLPTIDVTYYKFNLQPPPALMLVPCPTANYCPHSVTVNSQISPTFMGVLGDTYAWRTALQFERSRVLFPMGSSGFFIDIPSCRTCSWDPIIP